jgi:hypothetical protein
VETGDGPVNVDLAVVIEYVPDEVIQFEKRLSAHGREIGQILRQYLTTDCSVRGNVRTHAEIVAANDRADSLLGRAGRT